MREKVLAIFDIGKTNKKLLLFNAQLDVVHHFEEKFPTIVDEDGFECDDIELIEKWVKHSIHQIIKENKFTICGVNFSTYGASLTFIDEEGKRKAPLYNYLKYISPDIQNRLFEKYGSEAEFCRKTASPALGLLLNSGIQALWVKQEKPHLWSGLLSILHFPQYLSYLFTGKLISEPTSIGCHTFMWDFDQMQYHQWINEEQIPLPFPINNNTVFSANIEGQEVKVGTGIHDSSASLVPYLQNSEDPFILVSTGTWCINMNPFNKEPLTASQLKKDCLCFLTPNQEQVKSSRLFMGHFHEVLVNMLIAYFSADPDSYKILGYNADLLASLKLKFKGQSVFFPLGKEKFEDGLENIDLSVFDSFEEAYTCAVVELTNLCINSLELITSAKDNTRILYVSGGFAKNSIFVQLLQNHYPHKKVITSEIDNASALGAAMVIAEHFEGFNSASINLSDKTLTVTN